MDKKPYSDKRWTQDLGFKVTKGSKKDITKEDEAKATKDIEKMISFAEKHKQLIDQHREVVKSFGIIQY